MLDAALIAQLSQAAQPLALPSLRFHRPRTSGASEQFETGARAILQSFEQRIVAASADTQKAFLALREDLQNAQTLSEAEQQELEQLILLIEENCEAIATDAAKQERH